MSKLRLLFGVALAVTVVAAACTGQPAASRATGSSRLAPSLRFLLDRPGSPESPEDVAARDQWFYGQRSAPAAHIPAFARLAAVRQAGQLPVVGGAASWQPAGAANAAAATSTTTWKSLGPRPTIDDPGYNDPSNGGTYGAGFYQTTGRVTALATEPTNVNVAYLGGVDGGLWKTTDGGATWHRKGNFDTHSIGAITVVPAHPHRVRWNG